MNTATLIIIPGPGARTINLTPEMTIEQLIVQQNLHGRDIIVDGVGVAPQNYSSTIIPAT